MFINKKNRRGNYTCSPAVLKKLTIPLYFPAEILPLFHIVFLFKIINHFSLCLISRFPSTRLNEIGHRVRYTAALCRRFRRLFRPSDSPGFIRRHNHTCNNVILGDVPDHIISCQRQRTGIGLQHTLQNIVMGALFIKKVIPDSMTGLNGAHDLAECRRRSMNNRADTKCLTW